MGGPLRKGPLRKENAHGVLVTRCAQRDVKADGVQRGPRRRKKGYPEDRDYRLGGSEFPASARGRFSRTKTRSVVLPRNHNNKRRDMNLSKPFLVPGIAFLNQVRGNDFQDDLPREALTGLALGYRAAVSVDLLL